MSTSRLLWQYKISKKYLQSKFALHTQSRRFWKYIDLLYCSQYCLDKTAREGRAFARRVRIFDLVAHEYRTGFPWQANKIYVTLHLGRNMLKRLHTRGIHIIREPCNDASHPRDLCRAVNWRLFRVCKSDREVL